MKSVYIYILPKVNSVKISQPICEKDFIYEFINALWYCKSETPKGDLKELITELRKDK